MSLQKKYLPETWDEIVGQKEVVDILSSYKDIKSLPHLIFIGQSGVGKTASAYVLAKQLGVVVKELNASDSRGIDTIRNEVKTMLFTSGERIILLDEADNLCLPKGTEILKGYGTSKSIVPIEEIPQDRYISMQSLNIDTGEIEKDKGMCVDSGIINFYKLSLINGKELIASPNHPFFTIINNKVREIKLKDIKVGDEILDYQNDLKIRKCEICERFTVKKRFCSVKCQDKGHSNDMSGSGNSMYGKEAWNKGKCIEDDIRIKKQGHPGDSNCSKRPEVKEQRRNQFKSFWDSLDSKEKETYLNERLGISWNNRRGKTFEEFFGEKSDIERAKRSKYGIEGFKDSNYRRYLKGMKIVECECCHKNIKTNGSDGIYVHHKDGNRENNKRENLMFVCPYCHNVTIHDLISRLVEGRQKKALQNNSIPETIGDCPDLVKIIKVEYFGREKAYNITMKKNKNFFLGNGILTHNTSDAQAALRRPMELAKLRTKNRIIFTVNRPWKVTDALYSRCTNLYFKPLTKEALITIIYRVLKQEGLKFKDKEEIKSVINGLVSYSKGDARKLLDVIDNYSHSKESLIQYIQKRDAEVNQINEIFKRIIEGQWQDALMLLESFLIQQPTVNNSEIIELFYKSVKDIDIPPLKKFRVYERLGDVEKNLKLQCSPLVQISSFLASVLAVVHYK